MDNQARDEGNEPTTKPNSPSIATNSPSRKRLLTDPKPNQRSATASLEPTLSSDSSSDQFTKKTRDLPNLSDCHCCGLRINNTNPKDRLQPLDSMWRVVLLCKKCTKSIKSDEICPYCFSGSLELDCFKCRDCQHSIHKDCVVKYGGGFAPWSYYSSGSANSVCVDCWVPEAVVNSIRVCRRKSRRKNKKVVSEQSHLPGTNNCPHLLEEAMKDANHVVEKKIAVAAKANENALRKSVVAKNAVEIAKGALQFVVNKDEKSISKVVDDAELAFRLHRAINSSPRISKNKFVINSSCLGYREMHSSRGSTNTIACWKLEDYGNIKSSERADRIVSESSVCLKASDYTGAMADREPRSNGNGRQENEEEKCNVKPDRYMLKYHRITNTETSPNGNEKQDNEEEKYKVKPDRYILKYRRIVTTVSRRSASDCASCMDSGNLNTRAMSDTGAGRNDSECQENGEGRCNENPNRYLLKYQKRSIRSKTVLSCETKLPYNSICLENREAAPCYL